MNDAKQNRTPRPRPNFELPSKRLSLTLAEQIGEAPKGNPSPEPKPEPLVRVQTDSASTFRRFGGSVRDIQRSKGTLRTRNGWIIGDNSARTSNFGADRKAAFQPRIIEDAGKSDKVEEKPVSIVQEREVPVEDKENVDNAVCDSPVEISIEDSITKLQDDISQEIEAVCILLDSPLEEKDLSPTVEEVQDETESPIDELKPESPAPLKITRSQPVDIKSTKALHSSQQPEPAIPVTNNNKVQYAVNAPPTPSSTPPELEKRPKFEDRGVPTHAPVAPPTPPTKVMIMEDDKVVGEMTLDDGKGEQGYNVQQEKNPNAIAPSAEVSMIANKISELQVKADPNQPAPKPALPSISMEDFAERNQLPSKPAAPSAPSVVQRDPQFSFSRTNSMPPVMPSHNPSPAPIAAQRKAYEPQQYKPYRPPTMPTQTKINNPLQPTPGRVGSQALVYPQPSPSPVPPAHAAHFSQAIPPQVYQMQDRHSSLGNMPQYNQPLISQTPVPGYGRPQQWQAPQPQVAQNQIQPIRSFQQAPPPVPTHSVRNPPPVNNSFNSIYDRRSPAPPTQAITGAPRMTPAPMASNPVNTGRSLPPLPAGPPAIMGTPSIPTISFDESQQSPKESSPVTQTPPAEKPQVPIPTLTFDKASEPSSRRLPPVPNQPAERAKPMPPIPAIAVDDGIAEGKPKTTPPIPTFSFSDDSASSQRPLPSINLPNDSPAKPSIPIINFPDDDDNDNESKPSVPSFSFSGPEEPSDRRPLPTPTTQKQDSRPLPTPRGVPSGNGVADRRAAFETHGRAPSNRIPMPRSAASCTACGNHISARAVAASGLRFHPECFRCSHCSTRLEHVAFYPEPLGPDAPKDSPPTGRFFCHLDFHELYSPRCKSCKTPIEGEVVEACGATWHSGHFFCAECGDPFDAQSRFVEKDKFAWCLNCYQKRYSSKCKKCKKPVMDTVVKALDADWHMECFCCFECGSEFQDGRYFLRDGCKNEPVCTKCEETRLKSWDLVQ
ncbi:hypothetical protein ABW19_dt0209627 [Dactylella cylindrospora]|nr:hypothetical protein ABW19_dt0209627 [Dactylella cylindrospora]